MQASTQSTPLRRSILRRLEQLTGSAGNPVNALAIVILSLWALWNWCLTVRRVILDYNPLPVWDYWTVAEHLGRYRAFDLSVLWVQHNEHRIVFPECVFALDMLWFGGRQIFSLAVSVACYLGVWLVFSWALHSDRDVPAHVRKTAILLAGIILGWEGSSVVVGNTFLLQWTMLQFAVTLSLLLLALSCTSTKRAPLAGAIGCAVIATFSSGNGMLLWPILLIAARVLKLPASSSVRIASAGVLSIALYLVGYHSSSQVPLFPLVRHPVYFVCFLAAYVSMPLGAFGQPFFGVAAGLLNLAGWLLVLRTAIRRKLIATTPAIVFFGFCAFLLATGMLTAAGRMNPADPAYTAARAARYVSLPLANWGALVLALMWISGRARWQLLSPGTLAILVSLFVIGLTSALRPWIKGNGSFIAEQQVAAIAIENNVLDSYSNGKLYPDPSLVPQYLPVLKNAHVAIYAEDRPELRWLGRRAAALFTPCTTHASGRLAGVYPVEGGVEITGNASFPWNASQVVFVNERGRVVGWGEPTPAGVPDVLVNVRTHAQKAWVGFISLSAPSRSFSTYLLTGGKLCPLAGPETIPPVTAIAPTRVGPPLAPITWTATHWTPNALPPTWSQTVASGPPVNTFWSSWNGADSSTGRLVSSDIPPPQNACLVLSTLHGPSTDGLQLAIVNAATSQEIENIPLRSGSMGWTFLRVSLADHPPSALRIVARDEGTGWGQWLALGPPSACL